MRVGFGDGDEIGAMASGSGLGEIEECSESPEAGPVLEDKIFVAVGKEVKESKATLLWALRDARGKKVYILHVHQQAQIIPMRKSASKPHTLEQNRRLRFSIMRFFFFLCVIPLAKDGFEMCSKMNKWDKLNGI